MKKIILLLLVLIFARPLVQAQDWAKTKLEKSPRHQEWVKLKHGEREVNCFVVYPEVKDKATTIVLIHEIFGLSDWARAMADELAAEGYIVIAPDLLYGSVTNGGTEEIVKSGGNVGARVCDPQHFDLQATCCGSQSRTPGTPLNYFFRGARNGTTSRSCRR